MRVPLLLASLLLLASVLPGTYAAPEVLKQRDLTIASFDGIDIGATLYWLSGAEDEPRPAILTTHGWANDRSQRDADAEWLARAGYVVLSYDSRGYGDSGGTVGLDGPEEVADAMALIDWLAGRANATSGPRVLLDGPNDPRLGMTGLSYSGAIQLLVAAKDPRVDAIQPDITWNDLLESLAPRGVVKRGWVDLLFYGGMLTSHGASTGSPDADGMDARLREWYTEVQLTGRLPASAEEPLRERSPSAVLDNVSIPVFLTQGWPDTLFSPDEAVRTYETLAAREDADTHILFHPGGHGYSLSAAQKAHIRAHVERFFALHLTADDVAPIPAVQYWRAGWNDWAESATWPPASSTAVDAMGTGGVVTLPQAGAPTSRTEEQELEGLLSLPATDALPPTALVVPLGIEGPASIVGAPQVTLDVVPATSDLTLFFSLLDQSAGGDRVVHKQVAALRVEGQPGQSVTVALPLVATYHHLQAGHSLALRVTTSDAAYHAAREPGTVDVDAGSLTVGLLVDDAPDLVPVPATPANDGQARSSPGVGLWMLVACAALAALFRRRASI